jgi:hypothetical protein
MSLLRNSLQSHKPIKKGGCLLYVYIQLIVLVKTEQSGLVCY